MPDSGKLRKEFAKDNILWLNVSVDKERHKDKWLRYIKGYKMTDAVNVILQSNDRINDYLKVTRIPRYMIIDKGGIIFNGQAPRPSTREIRSQLRYVLNK